MHGGRLPPRYLQETSGEGTKGDFRPQHPVAGRFAGHLAVAGTPAGRVVYVGRLVVVGTGVTGFDGVSEAVVACSGTREPG